MKQKMEGTIDDLEDNLEREKKQRGDVEKVKRKLEGELKMTQETVEDLERVKRDLEDNIKRYAFLFNNESHRITYSVSRYLHCIHIFLLGKMLKSIILMVNLRTSRTLLLNFKRKSKTSNAALKNLKKNLKLSVRLVLRLRNSVMS